jgi:Zn-dependent M28 family amino/carboxypeptidase
MKKMKFVTRGGIIRVAILGVLFYWGCRWMTDMPGTSHRGSLPDSETPDGEMSLAERLRAHVEMLAGTIGDRNVHNPVELAAAADYISSQFEAAGLTSTRQGYDVDGVTCDNIIAEIPGGAKADEIVVVGGHYDSVRGCPGANDNGSGVAATLALAKLLSGFSPAKTLRFVAFVNEEPPYFQTDNMGSLVYARLCKERGDQVVAMFSLETMGYYTDEENSQEYPLPFSLFYPSTGNFIAFVGNLSSKSLVNRTVELFREKAQFPSEGAAVPSFVPGAGWSDNWSFWQAGYPALMVTDTAPFRYPHYHEVEDTPDKIDYDRLARVVAGLHEVIEDLANE